MGEWFGSLGETDRVAQTGDGTRAAEHRDHLVNAGAHGAASQCDAHRLSELAELQIEAREHPFEGAPGWRLR